MAIKIDPLNIAAGFNLSKINTNFTEIKTALDSAVSRDGVAPNSMNANLDMNGKRIINLPAPLNSSEPVRKTELDAVLAAGGSGDLISTLNLSDVENAGTSRTNLGLGSLSTLNTVDTAQVEDVAITNPKVALNAITQDKVADNAIGLPEMASGTAGNLITYDASGDPAAVVTGTSGQLLTSNGAGAAPTMQDPPASGGLILLETFDPVGSASFDIDITPYTPTHFSMLLRFDVFEAQTDAADLTMSLLTSGSPSGETFTRRLALNGVLETTNTGESTALIFQDFEGSGDDQGGNGEIRFWGLGDTFNFRAHVDTFNITNLNVLNITTGALIQSTSKDEVTDIRLTFSAGVHQTGVIKLYGYV